tara:strand:- start:1145 stop:1324 length:180 start_codon:yes stop_codon:yes gene_type:complete
MKLPRGLDPTKVRKIVKAIVICDDEDAWEEAYEDIKELISIMSNNKRQVTIIEIEEVIE